MKPKIAANNPQRRTGVAVNRIVMPLELLPLELHDALSATLMALHAIHQTMCQTSLFPQNSLEYDGAMICDAIKKVGKLKS